MVGRSENHRIRSRIYRQLPDNLCLSFLGNLIKKTPIRSLRETGFFDVLGPERDKGARNRDAFDLGQAIPLVLQVTGAFRLVLVQDLLGRSAPFSNGCH